jgi:hypothetical protein
MLTTSGALSRHSEFFFMCMCKPVGACASKYVCRLTGSDVTSMGGKPGCQQIGLRAPAQLCVFAQGGVHAFASSIHRVWCCSVVW